LRSRGRAGSRTSTERTPAWVFATKARSPWRQIPSVQPAKGAAPRMEGFAGSLASTTRSRSGRGPRGRRSPGRSCLPAPRAPRRSSPRPGGACRRGRAAGDRRGGRPRALRFPPRPPGGSRPPDHLGADVVARTVGRTRGFAGSPMSRPRSPVDVRDVRDLAPDPDVPGIAPGGAGAGDGDARGVRRRTESPFRDEAMQMRSPRRSIPIPLPASPRAITDGGSFERSTTS